MIWSLYGPVSIRARYWKWIVTFLPNIFRQLCIGPLWIFHLFPKGATSFPDWGSYDQIIVKFCLLYLVVKIYWVVLSCVLFCVVWVWSALAMWLAGKTYSLTATYLSKARYSLFLPKVPLNCSQSQHFSGMPHCKILWIIINISTMLIFFVTYT